MFQVTIAAALPAPWPLLLLRDVSWKRGHSAFRTCFCGLENRRSRKTAAHCTHGRPSWKNQNVPFSELPGIKEVIAPAELADIDSQNSTIRRLDNNHVVDRRETMDGQRGDGQRGHLLY